MENLEKILKTFKKLQPSEEFKARSRSLILAAQQNPKRFLGIRFSVFEFFKLGAALTLASILTFIVIGGISALKVSPSTFTSFDQSTLSDEAESLGLKIQLGEAQYFGDSRDEVSAALEKVSKPAQDDQESDESVL